MRCWSCGMKALLCLRPTGLSRRGPRCRPLRSCASGRRHPPRHRCPQPSHPGPCRHPHPPLQRFASGRCRLRCPRAESTSSAKPRRFCPLMPWPAVARRQETRRSCSARAASSFTCFRVLPDMTLRSAPAATDSRSWGLHSRCGKPDRAWNWWSARGQSRCGAGQGVWRPSGLGASGRWR